MLTHSFISLLYNLTDGATKTTTTTTTTTEVAQVSNKRSPLPSQLAGVARVRRALPKRQRRPRSREALGFKVERWCWRELERHTQAKLRATIFPNLFGSLFKCRCRSNVDEVPQGALLRRLKRPLLFRLQQHVSLLTARACYALNIDQFPPHSSTALKCLTLNVGVIAFLTPRPSTAGRLKADKLLEE